MDETIEFSTAALRRDIYRGQRAAIDQAGKIQGNPPICRLLVGPPTTDRDMLAQAMRGMAM